VVERIEVEGGGLEVVGLYVVVVVAVAAAAAAAVGKWGIAGCGRLSLTAGKTLMRSA